MSALNFGGGNLVPYGWQRPTYLSPFTTGQYNTASQGLATGYSALANAVLPGYQSLFDQGMGLADQFGQTQQMQIQNAYHQALGQQQQSLMNSGLGNATVGGSMSAGLLQNSLLNSTNAAEQTAGLKENVLGGLGSQLYGAQTQIGEAGLGAQQDLARQYLGMINQKESQRPSPWGYGPMAGVYGGYGGGGMLGGGGGGGGGGGKGPNYGDSIAHGYANNVIGEGATPQQGTGILWGEMTNAVPNPNSYFANRAMQ